MVNIPCTVKHITLTTVSNGSEYKGAIDREGNELPEVQMVASFTPSRREYYCSNCKRKFDGSETFDEVKAHFGTFPVD